MAVGNFGPMLQTNAIGTPAMRFKFGAVQTKGGQVFVVRRCRNTPRGGRLALSRQGALVSVLNKTSMCFLRRSNLAYFAEQSFSIPLARACDFVCLP